MKELWPFWNSGLSWVEISPMFDLFSVVGMEGKGIHAPPDSGLGMFVEFYFTFKLGNSMGDVIEMIECGA